MNSIHHEQNESPVNREKLPVENGQVSAGVSNDWTYPEFKAIRYKIPTLLWLRSALFKAEYGLSHLDPILLFVISSIGLVTSTWLYCRLSPSSNLITGLINALGLMVFASQSDYLELLRGKPDLTMFEAVLVHIVLLAMPTPTVLGLLSAIWPRLISRIELSGVEHSHGHIVFLGIGQRAVSLINACKQSYEAMNLPLPLIVAVDVNENAPAISELKSELRSKFVFIKGDYRFDTTLTSANVLTAIRVYITGSDDLTNASAISSINLLLGQRSDKARFPETFIHLSSSRSGDRKVDNPYRFDVRVSASRLFLMMYPPFTMNVSGYLEQHRSLVLVGADAFNERVLQTIGSIWQAEFEQEKDLLKYPSECESFGFTPSIRPLNIFVVDPRATVWVQAMKTRYTTLNDNTVNFISIDVETRFLSTEALSNIGENPLVCYSVEKEELPVEGLHQIYEVLKSGEIVCASWCRNPTEVIARELDSDKKEVHVRSFGLVDFTPSHKLLDGALWYDTAYRLHKEVYKSNKTFDLERNLSAVIRYPYLLATCGIRIVSDPVPNGFDMERYRSQLAYKNAIQISSTFANETEAATLAVLEHTRWLRESVSNGKKDNPSMKLWKDLDLSDKKKNNDASASHTGMPMLMADLGLAMQRVDSN
jgi:hypothetical protein